jgi:hypothetical protein
LEAFHQAEEFGLIRSTQDPSVFEFAHDRVRQTVRLFCVELCIKFVIFRLMDPFPFLALRNSLRREGIGAVAFANWQVHR